MQPLNKSIRIPGIELERRRIGKNLLVQRGPRERILDVEVHHHRGRCYLLKDGWERDTYLKLPRDRINLQEGSLVKFMARLFRVQTVGHMTSADFSRHFYLLIIGWVNF